MRPDDIPVGFVKESLKVFIEKMRGKVSEEQIMRDYEYVLKNWGGWEDLNLTMDDKERWEYALYLMKADFNSVQIRQRL